jgi:hypothetical protein
MVMLLSKYIEMNLEMVVVATLQTPRFATERNSAHPQLDCSADTREMAAPS